MRSNWMRGLGAAAVFLAGAAVATGVRPASADAPAATGGPRYTILDTDGTNLLVTDNGTNTFYFYTVDKDQPIGSDLKLRGSLDLKDVGKPVLKPKKAE